MYEVESIIGKKIINSKLHYRIKWQGYPIEQSTWEGVSHLKYIDDLIQTYEKEHSQENMAEKKGSKLLSKNGSLKKSNQQTLSKMIDDLDSQSAILKNGKNEALEKSKIIIKTNTSKFIKRHKHKIRRPPLETHLKTSKFDLAAFNRLKKKMYDVPEENNESSSSDPSIYHNLSRDSKDSKDFISSSDIQSININKSEEQSLDPELSIRIRLLEMDESQSDIRDYLVEYPNGTLKMMTSVDMTIAHPIEFINYLQNKINKRN